MPSRFAMARTCWYSLTGTKAPNRTLVFDRWFGIGASILIWSGPLRFRLWWFFDYRVPASLALVHDFAFLAPLQLERAGMVLEFAAFLVATHGPHDSDQGETGKTPFCRKGLVNRITASPA
jgi:hypothetical protein